MKKTQKTMVITKARKIDAAAKVGEFIIVDGVAVKVVESRAKKTAEPQAEAQAEADAQADAQAEPQADAQAEPQADAQADAQAETEEDKKIRKLTARAESAEKRAEKAESKAAQAEETARKIKATKTALACPAKAIVKVDTQADAQAEKKAEKAAVIDITTGAEMDKKKAEEARKKAAEEAAEAEEREKAAKAAARVGIPDITIHGNGFVREGKIADVTEFTKFYIALDIVHKCRATCAGYKRQLENNHPKVDFLTVSDDNLLKYAKEFATNDGKGRPFTAAEAGKVVDDRRALVYAEEQLKEQTKTEKEWNSLSYGAKNAVKLYAIRNYRGATLDKSVLDTGRKDDKGKPIYIDFTSPVKKAYQFCGNKNELANTVRGLVARVFPVNELTFGLSMTLSDILTADGGMCIASLAAAFGGSAKLDDNGNFMYFLDTAYSKVLKAFLVFVSVMVEVGAFKARDFKTAQETGEGARK